MSFTSSDPVCRRWSTTNSTKSFYLSEILKLVLCIVLKFSDMVKWLHGVKDTAKSRDLAMSTTPLSLDLAVSMTPLILTKLCHYIYEF